MIPYSQLSQPNAPSSLSSGSSGGSKKVANTVNAIEGEFGDASKDGDPLWVKIKLNKNLCAFIELEVIQQHS
jgi:hypothetical protein